MDKVFVTLQNCTVERVLFYSGKSFILQWKKSKSTVEKIKVEKVMLERCYITVAKVLYYSVERFVFQWEK